MYEPSPHPYQLVRLSFDPDTELRATSTVAIGKIEMNLDGVFVSLESTDPEAFYRLEGIARDAGAMLSINRSEHGYERSAKLRAVVDLTSKDGEDL